MPRAARSRLSPWIESMILSYGSPEGSSSGRLKAHVIGVGHMSQSQAQGSEGPTGLLFLSDGLLQIPAILTASAWEHLQEQEDRECFTSLLNTTVCIQDYRLQFHMALEQTKCRFFLSVGELATTAVGPVKDNTPCSTTLPSVRLKICKTWRALLGQETQESQKSQFDLSELLGEWQHDCLQDVLRDIRERLISRPVSLQPSTSTSNSSLTHSDAFTATSWGVDRVRCKGVKCFSVPVKCLLIPEEDALQLHTPPHVGSGTTSGLTSEDRRRDLEPPETTRPSVDDVEWRIAKPAFVESDRDGGENSPRPVEDSPLDEDTIAAMIDSDFKLLSNPLDIFSPPCDTTSLSDESPEATQSPQSPTVAGHSVILTSTQLPVHSSKESQHTSEHSDLPPYQKVPLSTNLRGTDGSSTTTPSNLSPDEQRTGTAQQNLPALEQESQILAKDTEERKCRKRKRSSTPEGLTTLVEEEAQISGSPPSWLFDTQAGSGAEEGSSHSQGQTAGTVFKKNPTVHIDGRQFSYSYQVSGQNLQDFSRFIVPESLLHWAVKYLVVPKETDNTSVTSNQTSTDRTQVTSLQNVEKQSCND